VTKRSIVIQSLWVLACAIVLGLAIWMSEYPDAEIPYIYLMYCLTVPAGFGVALLFALASNFFLIPGGLVSILVSWPLFVVLGYLQWFLFVPWAYRKATSWRNQHRT
jgi:uncharacterized membrane protein YedE/YeeE